MPDVQNKGHLQANVASDQGLNCLSLHYQFTPTELIKANFVTRMIEEVMSCLILSPHDFSSC